MLCYGTVGWIGVKVELGQMTGRDKQSTGTGKLANQDEQKATTAVVCFAGAWPQGSF